MGITSNTISCLDIIKPRNTQQYPKRENLWTKHHRKYQRMIEEKVTIHKETKKYTHTLTNMNSTHPTKTGRELTLVLWRVSSD